jgi:peptidoglycan/LPS O-acetylase OafA/YrhL
MSRAALTLGVGSLLFWCRQFFVPPAKMPRATLEIAVFLFGGALVLGIVALVRRDRRSPWLAAIGLASALLSLVLMVALATLFVRTGCDARCAEENSAIDLLR